MRPERPLQEMSFEVGSLVEGRIVEIVKFGVFVKIRGGKTGLVHISQISNEFVREVADYVSVGQDVVAKVVSVDDRGRIQLSLKEVTPEEEKEFLKDAKHDSIREDTEDRPTPRESPPRGEDNFEAKMKKFLRQSEDRLIDLKRSNEAKRGGGKKRR